MTTEKREITAKLIVDELQAGWSENSALSEHSARLLIGAKTDLGCVRENNEDKFEFFVPSDPVTLAIKGEVVAVADGMGGHAAGQIASELALKTFIKTYFAGSSADVEACLRASVREANAVVHATSNIPGRSGMGTTLTVAVVRGKELYVAQVGDSRLYFCHNGRLEQLTEDHSWVAEQVKMGAMSELDAESSPFRNVITRSMGNQPEVEPDITRRDIEEGDTLLLCSDGLSGVVGIGEMERALTENGPAECCQQLVQMALDRGGPDNVTILVARVNAIEPLNLDLASIEKSKGGNQAMRDDSNTGAELSQTVEAPKKKGFLAKLIGE